MIRIAISSAGKLRTESTDLLRRMGIALPYNSTGAHTQASNFPLNALFMPETELPVLVAEGLCDLAIVGSHLVAENQTDVQTLRRLNIGQRKLAIVTTNNSTRAPRTIATALPKLLGTHLKNASIRAKIIKTDSARAWAEAGVIDCFFDAIDTDKPIDTDKMRLVEKTGDSQAVVIGCQQPSAQNQIIIDNLLMRLDATLQATSKKVVALHIRKEFCDALVRILPCQKKPIVTELDNETNLVRSIMDEVRFWDVAATLKEMHATNITVTPVEQIIF